MTQELGVSQSPGDFFIFWNVIVPLTVLINIKKFGLRKHEIGLIIAMNLNPSVLHYVMQSIILSTVVVWFLILWLESILSRWVWYRIYTPCFAKHLLVFFLVIGIPSAILHVLWNPMNCMLRSGFKTFLNRDLANTLVDGAFMLIASFILLRVLMMYMQDNESKCRRGCDKA